MSIDILKDSLWIKSLVSIKKDAKYISQIMKVMPNSFAVNFENLNANLFKPSQIF